MKTKSEIFKLAHKIAKQLKMQGNYSVKFAFGLKAAYQIAKLYNKIDSETTIEFHTNGDAKLYSGVNSFGWETRIESMFLSSIMTFGETESQRFTRLAVEKYNKSKAA